MKAYVRETLREILFGFIKPLKGIDWPVEELEVRVIRKRKR
jgi:molybdopterin-guanine dinucleotide biosynthesis protein B